MGSFSAIHFCQVEVILFLKPIVFLPFFVLSDNPHMMSIDELEHSIHAHCFASLTRSILSLVTLASRSFFHCRVLSQKVKATRDKEDRTGELELGRSCRSYVLCQGSLLINIAFCMLFPGGERAQSQKRANIQ